MFIDQLASNCIKLRQIWSITHLTIFDYIWCNLTLFIWLYSTFFDVFWRPIFRCRRFSKKMLIIWQYLTFFDAQMGHLRHFRRHFWDIIWFDFIWLYLTNYWFDVIWRGCLFDVIWRYLTLEFDNLDVFWRNLTKFDKTSDKTLISLW